MTTLEKSRARRVATIGEQPRARRAARRAGMEKPPQTPPLPARLPARAGSAPTGKLGTIVELMRRPEGATIAQMSEATSWLPHSVRGALAGALKRKHGLTITSDKTDAGRVYRITEAAPEATA